MKISTCSIHLLSSLYLVASTTALASGFKQGLFSSAPSYASYEEAKEDFEAQGKIQKLDYGQAKKWFTKKGFQAEFENYFETSDFFEKKGYLKKVKNLYDGSGQFSFVRDGESVDKTVIHDVLVALFVSDFVYVLAKLRLATKRLGYTDEGLKEEVVVGDSFDPNLFSQDKKDAVKDYEEKSNEIFDPKASIVQLMQGNLKVSKKSNIQTPEVTMSEFQDVLKYDHDAFKIVHKRLANELSVTAVQSFKTNKLTIHKFDAKYNKKNLVYLLAGRERKNGQNNENETDLFLAFRGSQTPRDWLANFNAPLSEIFLRCDKRTGKCFMIEQLTFQKIEIERALYDKFTEVVEECGYPIKVHTGVLKYLFGKRGEEGKVDADKDDNSMYTNVRLNIQRLLDNEGAVTNSLYVTGHSLGGALSTLGAFFLACDKGINNQSPDWKGVKCISFAGFMVGNVSFQRAFEVLQSKEQYQSSTAKTAPEERLFKNIRFTNNRDPVPMVPPLSKYRHVAGPHVHLKWRVLGLRRKPMIEAQRAHWKSSLDFNRPWKVFHPTSLIAGLFASSLNFLGLVATTIPLVFVVPFLMIKPFQNLFPPFSQFKEVFLKIAATGIFENALCGTIATIVTNRMFKVGLVGLSWASVIHLMTKKDSSTVERAGLIGLGIPGLVSMTRFFVDKSKYLEHAAHWQVHFLVGIIVAQIAMLVRKPLEVVTVKVHSLDRYYENLRPYHPLLSSSTAIIDHVFEDIDE